jgi:transposase InsO family protein
MQQFFAAHDVRGERLMPDRFRRFRDSKVFQAALADLGIQHRMTRPYHPQTNGNAERFIDKLLADWAYVRVFRNNADRIQSSWTQPPWVVFVNKVRGNHS